MQRAAGCIRPLRPRLRTLEAGNPDALTHAALTRHPDPHDRPVPPVLALTAVATQAAIRMATAIHKAALKDHGKVAAALFAHAAIEDLIARVKSVEPDGVRHDARVEVGGKFVEHRVEDERDQMLSKAKKARLDLPALRVRMTACKAQPMAGRWRPAWSI